MQNAGKLSARFQGNYVLNLLVLLLQSNRVMLKPILSNELLLAVWPRPGFGEFNNSLTTQSMDFLCSWCHTNAKSFQDIYKII